MYTITNNNHARAAHDGFICTLHGRKFILLCSGGEIQARAALKEKGYSQTEISEATNKQVDCMQLLGAHTFIVKED